LNVADQHKSYKYDLFCGKKSPVSNSRQQSTINNVGQAILYDGGDVQKEQRGTYSYRRSRRTGKGNRREMMKIRCNTELTAGQLWILKTGFLSTGIQQTDGETNAKATAG